MEGPEARSEFRVVQTARTHNHGGGSLGGLPAAVDETVDREKLGKLLALGLSMTLFGKCWRGLGMCCARFSI